MTKDQISWIVLGATLIVAIAFVLIYSRFVKKANFSWIRFIARVAIFSALSTILYIVKVFEVHLPFLPPFLALHFDEIPAFIAGYAYGPYAALIVILVKTIIKLPFTSTLAVGKGQGGLWLQSAVHRTTQYVHPVSGMLQGVDHGHLVSTKSLTPYEVLACTLKLECDRSAFQVIRSNSLSKWSIMANSIEDASEKFLLHALLDQLTRSREVVVGVACRIFRIAVSEYQTEVIGRTLLHHIASEEAVTYALRIVACGNTGRGAGGDGAG